MTSISTDGVVEFSFFRRDVSDVRVVGDFGASQEHGVAMTGSADGWWRANVALGAGEYRFRYIADGTWYADYASNGIEISKAGLNSVLVVPGRTAPAEPVEAAQTIAAKKVA